MSYTKIIFSNEKISLSDSMILPNKEIYFSDIVNIHNTENHLIVDNLNIINNCKLLLNNKPIIINDYKSAVNFYYSTIYGDVELCYHKSDITIQINKKYFIILNYVDNVILYNDNLISINYHHKNNEYSFNPVSFVFSEPLSNELNEIYLSICDKYIHNINSPIDNINNIIYATELNQIPVEHKLNIVAQSICNKLNT